jgi:hypothetical protein
MASDASSTGDLLPGGGGARVVLAVNEREVFGTFPCARSLEDLCLDERVSALLLMLSQ